MVMTIWTQVLFSEISAVWFENITMLCVDLPQVLQLKNKTKQKASTKM